MLTGDASGKEAMHLSFSLAGSDLRYEAGDALGVLAANDPALVADILAATHLIGEEPVVLAKAGQVTLSEALTRKLAITRLSRKLVDAYASWAT